MINMHCYVYHVFIQIELLCDAYCSETPDTIIFNFTLPTQQSFKHSSIGLFNSLLDESFGALLPFIKHFFHSFF